MVGMIICIWIDLWGSQNKFFPKLIGKKFSTRKDETSSDRTQVDRDKTELVSEKVL